MNEIFRVIGNAHFLPKVVSFLLISFVVLWKWSKDHLERKELSKRKRIENLTQALTDEKVQNNAFVIEQLFQDRYGQLLEYKAIKYFLCQESPSIMINQYLSARHFLKFNETYTHLVPKYKLRGAGFNWISWIGSILFGICGMGGLVCLIAATMMLFQQYAPSNIVWTICVAIIFFLYSALFFDIVHGAESAIKLKHITRQFKASAKSAPP